MKLNVESFALTCAVLWGLGLFCLTWWIILFDGPADVAAEGYSVPFLGRIYRGYSITAGGSFIGLAWAFFDGLIGGALFAWLYNLMAGRREAEAGTTAATKD